MTKGRVEAYFELSLDQLLKALPDPSSSTWDGMITFATLKVPTHHMLVRRRENQLQLALGTLRFRDVLVRQSLTMDPRRRGGYTEFLICPGCDYRARKLFLPIGAYEFSCRSCHDLPYASETRHRRFLQQTMTNGDHLPRRGPRLSLARRRRLGVATNQDFSALDALIFGPRRPKRGRPKKKRNYVRRAYDKQKCLPNEAYCVRCKRPRRIAEPVRTAFRNGRPAIRGSCAVCGATIWQATKKTDLSEK